MMHLAFAFLSLFGYAAAIQTSKESFNDDFAFSGGNSDTLAAVPKRNQLRIPLQIVMTAKSGGIDDIKPQQQHNVRETLALNPGLKLRFLNDDACREFISRNYGSELLSAFVSETHGAYRGDICRAAVLAIEGGFYTDLDVQVRVPFVDMVDESTTFMSAVDIYCNILNAIIATEPNSAVMQSVLVAIKDWYAAPKGGPKRPEGSYMGTTTMRSGLDAVVSRDCPGMGIVNLSSLQRSCGSHHQFRFYQEEHIRCSTESTECPRGRKNNAFMGAQFGLFEPGPKRNLVAWSRFESCKKWGCDEGREAKSTLGACERKGFVRPGGPVRPTSVRPAPVVPVAGYYNQVNTRGPCCRGSNITTSPDGYTTSPAKCERLCDADPNCMYFDHIAKHRNCQMCADCDDEKSAEKFHGSFTSWAKPTPASSPTASSYSQVKTAGQCCRGDSISSSGDEYTTSPAMCERLCDADPKCLYFDHSTEWENCNMCADCDDGHSDELAYAKFTSWKKVASSAPNHQKHRR